MTKQGTYDTMEVADIRERLKAEIMSLTNAQLEYVLEVLKHGEDFMRTLSRPEK